jgi:hypothetical protein
LATLVVTACWALVLLVRKVYHGRSEGKRWSVHMTQIKL